ncbi:MAG: ribosome silencing factor [Cytophagales bacterium]|nr:MAG: ribosome silencing factor [Cytophagales bacterium]
MVKTKEAKKPSVRSETLCKTVIEGMQEKKGLDIVVLDLREIKGAVTDFFVICSANSDTQAEALMNSVAEQVYKGIGEDVWQKEGAGNREWILLDFVDVVAHIFKKDRRKFYGLEELWGDAEISFIND